jgi:very-short-patch-repair endonuclease
MFACSPFGPAGEFAASRHGVLTRSQAASFGLSSTVVARLVRDGLVLEPAPGVLVAAGSPRTWEQRLYVATLASKGAGAAGFRSAAALHRLDGFCPGPVELVLPSARKIELPGLVMRRRDLEPTDLTIVGVIPTTTVARTLVDLSGIVRGPALTVALDSAWRQGVSLTWIAETAQRVASPGRPGPRRLLGLVERAMSHRSPTESALEVAVERALGNLPGLVRQHEVRRADGSFVARVDFAIPALKIAIEAHSRRHHFGVVGESSDADREAALQGDGWIVRFITAAQARDPGRLRFQIDALITSRRSTSASGPR